jgi:hypothetical protein
VKHAIHLSSLFEEALGIGRAEESQPDCEFNVTFDFRE